MIIVETKLLSYRKSIFTYLNNGTSIRNKENELLSWKLNYFSIKKFQFLGYVHKWRWFSVFKMEFNLNLNWDERVAYLTEIIHQSSEFLDLLTSLILEEVPTILFGIISCWECLKVTVFSPQELKENTIIMTGLAEVMPQ